MHPAQIILMECSLAVKAGNSCAPSNRKAAIAALPQLRAWANAVPADLHFRFQRVLRTLAACARSGEAAGIFDEVHGLAVDGEWNLIWYANYIFGVFAGPHAPALGGVFMFAAKRRGSLMWEPILIGSGDNMQVSVAHHPQWGRAEEHAHVHGLGPLHVHAMPTSDAGRVEDDLVARLRPALNPIPVAP